MLKIFSKLKPTQTNTPSRAEADILAILASPEKTAQLISKLEADLLLEKKYSARYRLLTAKLDQARNAQKRHEIEAERQRVASVVKRDQATFDKALLAVNDAYAKATAELELHESKRLAVVNRLAPLEAERQILEQTAVKRAAEAQIEFDAAIAQDNAEAESNAAAKLYQAKQPSYLSGPLELRISALQREIESHAEAVAVVQSQIEQAAQDRLIVQAEIDMLEYDRQAQLLLDAFVVQDASVRAALDKAKPGASSRSMFRSSHVEFFESQVSSPERIVFGSKIDAYNKGHLPFYAIDSLREAKKFKPDLSILTAKLEDLPPDEAEPAVSATPEADRVSSVIY